jgi:transcriptional regulator with XRE-family HTH domain
LAAELCKLSPHIAVSRESVSRWEAGRREPRPYSLRNIATALGVDVEDLSPVNRREFVAAAMALGPLAQSGTGAPAGRSGVGVTDVEAVEEITRTIRDLDNRFGGGHAYPLASQYLHARVLVMIRQGSYRSGVGKALHRAGAQLAHLAAWTAYDIAEHDWADAHFRIALELSAVGGDKAFGGEVLAARSHHAIHLGNAHQAIELARSSQDVAKRVAVPALYSEACILEANALALSGDKQAAVSALHRAEVAFDQIQPENTPGWLNYLDEGYIAARFAHTFRDLGDWRQARYFATKATAMSDAMHRTQAFNLTVLATAHVESDPDEACSLGTEVLSRATGLQSGRIIGYLSDLQRRLRKHYPSHRRTLEFAEQTAVLLGR